MAKPILVPEAHAVRVANWGLRFLGIVCLGIGLLFAIGAVVDLDFMIANHLNGWPPQVIIEIGIAMMLMGFGPWCLLQRIRATSTDRSKSSRRRILIMRPAREETERNQGENAPVAPEKLGV
jgi:hypothetical protein